MLARNMRVCVCTHIHKHTPVSASFPVSTCPFPRCLVGVTSPRASPTVHEWAIICSRLANARLLCCDSPACWTLVHAVQREGCIRGCKPTGVNKVVWKRTLAAFEDVGSLRPYGQLAGRGGRAPLRQLIEWAHRLRWACPITWKHNLLALAGNGLHRPRCCAPGARRCCCQAWSSGCSLLLPLMRSAPISLESYVL